MRYKVLRTEEISSLNLGEYNFLQSQLEGLRRDSVSEDDSKIEKLSNQIKVLALSGVRMLQSARVNSDYVQRHSDDA